MWSPDNRWWGLFFSIVHYGLGNFAKDSRPPRARTVRETATAFEKQLNGEDVDEEK